MSSRIATLETTRQAHLEAEALDGLRLCWQAENRLTLAEHCSLGEGNTTRMDALYEEVGAVACERALEARYGRRAVQEVCERIIARMEAEVSRKDEAGEPLTADERLFSGQDGAMARFSARCTDAERDSICAVKNAERAALVRTIATNRGEL